MISRFYEAWRMVEVSAVPDGAGSSVRTEADGERFTAGLCGAKTHAVSSAGKDKGHVSGTLMHPRAVHLRCGQLIRRERDGAVFRVLSDSHDCMAPEHSSVDAAQTTVERLVEGS